MEEKNHTKSSCTYHMNGGNGPDSYTQNSTYQKGLVGAAKQLIYELIDQKLDIVESHSSSSFGSNPFRIVDLGCSVGPNTFSAVENIIDAVKVKYKSKQQSQNLQITPEFHVFFNDHVGNDFNTLFNAIPASQEYFSSGVPGSYHGRLFPRASLHFAHSSYALHWLSKIPKEVIYKDSLAWNKGRITYTGKREVGDAYSAQFTKDMEAFLSSRAQELVPGGLMVILILGLPDGVLHAQTTLGMGYDLFGSCLEELANTGRIDAEKVDSFNLPFYYPCPKELKALVETNGCFNIEKIEILDLPVREEDLRNPRMCAKHFRAVIQGVVEENFGSEIVDDLFECLAQKLEENAYIFDHEYRKETHYFVSLKRKQTR